VAARLRWFGCRLADLGTGLVDAFLRDNKVLPPVLAVLALFIMAWILAGAFMGGGDQKPVAYKADLAKSDLDKSKGAPGSNRVSSGVENRDVNSYAAYRSKDPFREILAPAKTTQEQTATQPPQSTTPASTAPESTTGSGRTPGRPSAGGRGGAGGAAGGAASAGAGSARNGTGGASGGRGASRGTSGRGGKLLNSGGILPIP
jgi:hypothetical protein